MQGAVASWRPLMGDSCLILGGVPGLLWVGTPEGQQLQCGGRGGRGVIYVPSTLFSVKVMLLLAGMSGSYPSCLSGEGRRDLAPAPDIHEGCGSGTVVDLTVFVIKPGAKVGGINNLGVWRRV